ncbi:MAG: polyprenol monophosphomannose synthase [Planctomycetia bacterium]|nr:polyprenol monophosphomannose synthase [Planctomycetia bacterium]
MDKQRYLIVVATYNERDNIAPLVEEIFRQTDPLARNLSATFDLLVVDDNSPDGTGIWCDENAARYPRLKCLHRTGKNGLGTAVVEAMEYAIRERYDRMINMDADFSHPPRYLPDLCVPMADVVIGSRYTSGGKILGWPWYRHLMSRCMNAFGRALLGLQVRDISGSYRNYAVEKLREIDFSKIQSHGYSFFEEILWRLQLAGATLEEIPITFEDRVRGNSKINWRESLSAVRTLLTLKR